MKGIVKKHLPAKGFGFIRADDGTEYFFHNSACARGEFDGMTEGTPVIFSVSDQPAKGPRAEAVRRAPAGM